MFSSKPIIINKNYGPLTNEHPSLQYYFKELFQLLDTSEIDQSKYFELLIDKYLNFCNKYHFYSGQITQQRELAERIKIALSDGGIEDAFDLINETSRNIDPNDDLIWLLSAYCSLFPFAYSGLTHQNIKNALVIRDMNDIYYHTILTPILTQHTNQRDYQLAENKFVEVAYFTDQYELLLQRVMHDAGYDKNEKTIDLNVQYILDHMQDMIKYATEAQVKNIILPSIMISALHDHVTKKTERILSVLRVMPSLIAKISAKTIETIIVPALISFYQNSAIAPFLKPAFLACIHKMNADALKREFLPFLMSKAISGNAEHHAMTLQPLLAAMAKLSPKENDEISIKLMPYLLDVDHALTFLKDLRKNKIHVNSSLFQHAESVIHYQNDAFIKAMEKNKIIHDFNELYVSHMTAAQVKRFFSAMSLEEIFQMTDENELLVVLESFASLPPDIYPASLQMHTLEFLLDKCHHDEFIPAIIAHLKKLDYSNEHFKKILLNLCDISIEKTHAKKTGYIAGYYDEYQIAYFKLLETCASLMTEQEIKDHIIDKIDSTKLHESNYCKMMHGTFKHIFLKLNDPRLLEKYFKKLLPLFLKNQLSDAVADDLFPILIDRMDPVTHIATTRFLLKNNISNQDKFENIAYLLMLIYQKNKTCYSDIPGFCIGKNYEASESKSRCAIS